MKLPELEHQWCSYIVELFHGSYHVQQIISIMTLHSHTSYPYAIYLEHKAC